MRLVYSVVLGCTLVLGCNSARVITRAFADFPGAVALVQINYMYPMRFTPSPLSATSRLTPACAFWHKLLKSYKSNMIAYWGMIFGVVVLATLLRFYNLSDPKTLIFDETYYVKDAYTLYKNGYESEWPRDMKPEDIDKRFVSGDTDFFTNEPEFLAHPHLGKYIIGAGIELFGVRSQFGWRIAVALIGVLGVFMTAVIAARLFESTLIGGIAGFLFAIENNAIVMSRVAILDNVLMIISLIAVWCVLLDRQWYRKAMSKWVQNRSKHLSQDAKGNYLVSGPLVWWRPWLALAAVLMGMAASVKWSGIFYYFGIIPYITAIDWTTRKQLGIKYRFQGTFYQVLVSGISSVIISVFVYIALWANYFIVGGWGSSWATYPGNGWAGPLAWVPKIFQSWVNFQVTMYRFNSTLTTPHIYEAPVYTWPFLIRPTNMYWTKIGDDVRVIIGLPNPLLWWAAVALFIIFALIAIFAPSRRDWRMNFILMTLAGGYFPWFLYVNRTIFHFYTIVFEPFMIIMIAAAIYKILEIKTENRLLPTPWVGTRRFEYGSRVLAALRGSGNRVREACFVMPARIASLDIAPVMQAPLLRLMLVVTFLLAATVCGFVILPINMAWPVHYKYWESLMILPSWK